MRMKQTICSHNPSLAANAVLGMYRSFMDLHIPNTGWQPGSDNGFCSLTIRKNKK